MQRMFENDPVFATVLGVRSGTSGGYVVWDSTHVFGPAGTHTAAHPIQDVSVAPNGTVYIATSSDLEWGSLTGGSWSTDSTVIPQVVAVLASGEVVISDATNGVRLKNGASWTSLPGGSGARGLAGASSSDLYMTTSGTKCGIFHYDGTGWSPVITYHQGGFGLCISFQITMLPDGTVAVASSELVFGHGQSWTTLPILAYGAAGTSMNDLWFAGTTDPANPATQVADWNGQALAQVQWQYALPIQNGIAIGAGGDVMVIATGDRYVVYTRWAVP
jgi:hypothetical protein